MRQNLDVELRLNAYRLLVVPSAAPFHYPPESNFLEWEHDGETKFILINRSLAGWCRLRCKTVLLDNDFCPSRHAVIFHCLIETGGRHISEMKFQLSVPSAAVGCWLAYLANAECFLLLSAMVLNKLLPYPAPFPIVRTVRDVISNIQDTSTPCFNKLLKKFLSNLQYKVISFEYELI